MKILKEFALAIGFVLLVPAVILVIGTPIALVARLVLELVGQL